MLFTDTPARIADPGTFSLVEMSADVAQAQAVYTVGRDHVLPAMKRIFRTGRAITCDIETYGLGRLGWQMKCVQFGNLAGDQAVIMDPRDPAQEHLVRHTIAHASELWFHNSAYDVVILYLNGLMTLEDVWKVSDTLLYARLADPDERVSKNLLEAANRYLGNGSGPQADVLKAAFRALGMSMKDGFHQFDLDRPLYLQGAASDPIVTARLRPAVIDAAYRRTTERHPFNVYGVTGAEADRLVHREQIINRMLLRRSCKGLRVDFEYLDRYREENAAVVAEAERELEAHGVRPGVGADLMKVLAELGAVPEGYPRTGKTKVLSSQAKHVETIPHPLARQFIAHKRIQKVGSDYLQKVVDLADDNGLIHPACNVLVAATGRASMGDPPIHQFSGPARGIILADEDDDLTSIDWSTIEPITAAYTAKDTKVIIPWETESLDLYVLIGIMAGLFPPGSTKQSVEADPVLRKVRKILKIVLLAQMYGEGLAKLTADLGLDPGPYRPPSDWEIQVKGYKPGKLYPDYAEAKRWRSNIFNVMPGTAELISKLKAIANQYRKIFTLSGRILTVPSAGGRAMAHKGVNYYVQGSAYDVLAEAMIGIHDAGLSDALYLTMHDEMVVSTAAAHDVRKIMQTPPDRMCFLAGRTPVLRTDMADLGERWAEA